MKRKENIAMARNPYASAEESLSVMSKQKATAAHLDEVLRLIDEAGLNEQGVTNAKYVSGIINVCATVVKQRNELREALQLLLEQDDNGEDEIWVRNKGRAAIFKATGGAA